MAFVDEMTAVAEKTPVFTSKEKREILENYRDMHWIDKTYGPLNPYVVLERLTRDVIDLPNYDHAYENWANTNRLKTDTLQKDMQMVVDRRTASKTPYDVGRLLGYAKAAEGVISGPKNNVKPEDSRLLFELYLACQKALGDIWGYDRVSAGTYKSQRGHVRNVVKSFVSKQPQDLHWALETLHRYERQPDQLKLDFA